MSRPAYGATVPGNRWDLLADRPAAPVSVSVVVTHFEQPRQLARTLAALAGQTRPASEVIVVDDGSRVIPEVPPGVRLLRQADRGFRAAAARNLGARSAEGQVLVFLDADTTPEADYLARITRLPSLLPEALVVGRRRHADLSGTGETLTDPAWLREGYARTSDLLDADETSFRYVISAVVACSAWLHDLVGGFDETFSTYGGEDWDWAHRVWNQGGLLAHEPRAVAWHDGPDQAGRGAPGERLRLLAETLEVGRRIGVRGTAPAGLDLGGPDVLVVGGPELSAEALVVSVDSVLGGVPHARIDLTPAQAAAVPALLDDARVRVGRRRASFQRLVELRRGVRGEPATWQRLTGLVRGPGAPGVVEVEDLAAVTALRARRREGRWDRTDLFEHRWVSSSGLDPVGPAISLQSHVGGW